MRVLKFGGTSVADAQRVVNDWCSRLLRASPISWCRWLKARWQALIARTNLAP